MSNEQEYIFPKLSRKGAKAESHPAYTRLATFATLHLCGSYFKHG
jgi:hypothetical protein